MTQRIDPLVQKIWRFVMGLAAINSVVGAFLAARYLAHSGGLGSALAGLALICLSWAGAALYLRHI